MKSRIKQAMPFIITGLILITVLIVQFTTMSASIVSVEEFVTSLIVNSAILIVMSITWIFSGKDKAKNEVESSYSSNIKIYGEKINGISEKNQIGELERYCDIKTQELLQNKTKRILASVGIDYTRYVEEYKGKDTSSIHSLSSRQKHVIKRINEGKVTVKNVSIAELLADSKNKHLDSYGVDFNEQTELSASVITRTIKYILTACVFSFLTIQLSTNIASIEAWAMFFMKIVLCLTSAWSGYNEGYNQIADRKNKVILKRIMFLNMFEEHKLK